VPYFNERPLLPARPLSRQNALALLDTMDEMEKTLREVLKEKHYWCTLGQVVDPYELPDGTLTSYLLCCCGKEERDARIQKALGES
jgi:hypothetical protein